MEKCCKYCEHWLGYADDLTAGCMLHEIFDGELEEYYCEIRKCTDTCDQFTPEEGEPIFKPKFSEPGAKRPEIGELLPNILTKEAFM